MERRFTILAIVIAGIIASVLGGGLFDLWDTAIGITILFVLKLFPFDDDISFNEKAAYSCAKGLAYVMVVGFIIDGFFLFFGPHLKMNKVFLESGSPIYLGSFFAILLWCTFSLLIYRKINTKPANHSLDLTGRETAAVQNIDGDPPVKSA